MTTNEQAFTAWQKKQGRLTNGWQTAKKAWDYQQDRIDALEEALRECKATHANRWHGLGDTLTDRIKQ